MTAVIESVMAKWLKNFLSAEDVIKISESIRLAEEHTSGEIVPVIVRRSSAIGHVPFSLTLILLVGLLFVEFPWKDILFVTPWIYLWPVWAVLLFLVSLVLARSKRVQRCLIPNHDEAAQVFQRAQLEFYLNGVNKTELGTGILIFVSVMERRAVILADQGIAQKIGAVEWQRLVDKFSAHLVKGEWAQGFHECIQECAQLLSTHFPVASKTRNQLQNDLVIKE